MFLKDQIDGYMFPKTMIFEKKIYIFRNRFSTVCPCPQSIWWHQIILCKKFNMLANFGKLKPEGLTVSYPGWRTNLACVLFFLVYM